MMTELAEELDPGVKDLVLLLRSHGWNTTDSGDGKSKPEDLRTIEGLHIVIDIQSAADLIVSSHTLLSELRFFGYGDLFVEATYSPNDQSAILLIREV